MTQQEAISKALKLLALSKGTNHPEEAATAMAKAQEILDRYRLNVDDLDFDAQDKERDNEEVKDFGFSDPLDEVEYLKAWMTSLAECVTRDNQCRIVLMKMDLTQDPNGKARGAAFKIIGRPSDVQVARYLYGYMKGEVIRLRDSNCAGHSGTYKRQFCLGVVDTISRKLEQQRRKTQQEIRSEHAHNPHALVRVDKAIAKIDKRAKEVEDFLNGLEGLRSTSHGGTKNPNGMAGRLHGRIAGEQVRFSNAKGSLGSSRKELGE